MATQIRFHLDEHIPTAIARGLRLRGIDVTTTVDANLRTSSDLTQLEYAARESRVFVTHDDDFLILHSQGVSHAGICLLP